MINSILTSLPLYFFSFFKAPKKVITKLVKLQCCFLWSGMAESNKICGIKWDTICLPKEDGRLGVKDLEACNKSLLSKWRCRFLNDFNSIWYRHLSFRYGELHSSYVDNYEV